MTLPGTTALTLISVDDSGDRHIDEEASASPRDYHPTDEEIRRVAEGRLGADRDAAARDGTAQGIAQPIRPKVRVGQDCSVSGGYRDLSVAFESADPGHAHAVGKTALSSGAELAVVTLGAEGRSPSGRRRCQIKQPAVHVDAVDTTGAGDSFIAGFIAGFLQSLDLATAMATGAAWAARTCIARRRVPTDPTHRHARSRRRHTW